MKKLVILINSLIFAFSCNLTAQNWTLIDDHIQGEAQDDFFGISAAISRDGTTVAISSIGNDDGGSNAGHVRVYSLSGSNLVQVGIDIDGLSNSETIGGSVAINENGSVIAVSASGGVKVYEWNEALGFHIRKGNKAGGGTSLALSSDGNTLLSGSLHSGITVYDYDGTNWVKRGTDNYLGRIHSNDESGKSVAMSADGNIIAVGIPGYDYQQLSGYTNIGDVRVFEWVDDEWAEINVSVDNDIGDYTGNSIALSEDGSRLVVASYSAGSGPNPNASGKVEVFQRASLNNNVGYNSIVGQTLYGDGASMTWFGMSVAISSDGNVVSVSSVNNIQTYQWNGYFWVKVGDDINYNIDAINYQGYEISSGRIQVDLSGDGNLMLASDPDSGINGKQSGIASVYNYLAPPEPKVPVLNLDTLYESQNDVNTTIDATPVDGWPTSYTYQWYFNDYAIPALYGGADSSIIISGSDSSNGTYQVDVTNTTGSVTGQFEYRVFVDSDGDGLSNYRESNILNTNPNSIDTDGDSLSDSDEVNIYYTDPSLSDSNGDGFDDGFIITNGFDKDEDYNAFLSNANEHLTDLRVGSTMIDVSENQATIQLQMEESSDLQSWQDKGDPATMTIPADTDTKFFRFKMVE